jgi:signal transduction histidine kinase
MLLAFDKIYNSSLKFLEPLSIDKTYELVVREAVDLVGAVHGSLFVPEKGKMKRVFTTCKGLEKVEVRKLGVTRKAFGTGKPIVLSHQQLVKIHPEFAKLPINSDLSYPMVYNKIRIGTLSLLSPKGKNFAKREIEIIKRYVPLATLAIKKAVLYEAINEALRGRDLFISMAAHELKNPLASIILYIDMLKRAIPENKLPEGRYLRNLADDTRRLLRLINNFMDINKIKKGKLHFEKEELDIHKVIKKSISEFRHSYKSHEVVLSDKGKGPMTVRGDFDKLVEMMVNILNNAGKYSEVGSTIFVDLKHNRESVCIKIRDQGIGIDKEDLPLVRKKYYRGENINREGLGIGLYLADYIARNHSGNLELESKAGEGTVVTIKLPVVKKVYASNNRTPAEMGAGRQL